MSHTIWTRCLSQLESELNAQQLNTWIRPLQIEESERDLKLLAPNRFVRDWVKDHFFARIEEISLSIAKPHSIKVSLEIGSSLSKPVTGKRPGAQTVVISITYKQGGDKGPKTANES